METDIGRASSYGADFKAFFTRHLSRYMKRYGNLYDQITTFDNLYLAYRLAAKGKRGQTLVSAFDFDLEANLFQLQDELMAQTYRPGAYRSFYINDPKHRLISAAPFRDRVVHHALCNIIEPIFERTFIGDSYANRVWKGTHRALNRAQAWARQYRYVLQCDIRQFFPSIDHALLRSVLARKLVDERVLTLIDRILQSGAGVLANEYAMVYFPGDDLFAINRPRGLPIGNLTSQFWANVYLNELDQFVKRRLHAPAYLRYVDDFLLFSNDKGELWQWKAALIERLNDLRLMLHDRESTVYPVSTGIPFLGWRVYPNYRKLKRRNGVAFARRLRKWYAEVARGALPVSHLHERVQGWVAHAEQGNTWRLRRSLLSAPIGLPPCPNRRSSPARTI